MPARVVEVAVPLPFQTPFSYRLPAGVPMPEAGTRALVPFGARRVVGMVTGEGRDDPAVPLKEVLEILDEQPLPTPPLLELASWMAEHYLAPPGECYRLVLPPAGAGSSRAVARLVSEPPAEPDDPLVEALRGGPVKVSTLAHRLGKDPTASLARLRRAGVVAVDQALALPGFRHVRVARLTGVQAALRGTAQTEAVERLRRAGGRMSVPALVRDRPALRGAVRRLEELGVVRIEEERSTRTPAMLDGGLATAPAPSAEQAQVLEPILDAVSAREFTTFLLHGITASGKTEVYFRAAERGLEAGRGCLILVPEIALTPLLTRAAVARFGPTVSVIHSELSLGERHDQWWRIRVGEVRVVVGARSALFLPIADLGLIVVDEEHESAYKQQESPRYHARDVAVVRGKLEGVPVLLGSATPSVESYANALGGKYRKLVLGARIRSGGLPRVEIVDRRSNPGVEGHTILTPTLHDAVAARLSRHEQALLLLNRRGYATSLICRECGSPALCRDCSVTLTLHRGGRKAECHYCGYQVNRPARCGSCRGEYLKLTGYGTERVVEALSQAFPTARVGRLDRDQTRRRGAAAKVLAAFEAGQSDILVGTQMVAKGHDFPRVTLVGVIDADVGLGLPDFRAAERTFQLLTQVAGRAGRGEVTGEVILQTHLPDHYALRLACAQDYESFYERETEFRRTMGYPPRACLINVVLRAQDPGRGAKAGEALAARLRALADGRYRVLGPALAPLARLKKEHRFQILLKGPRRAMRLAVRQALTDCYGKTRWPGVTVDVDPVSVM